MLGPRLIKYRFGDLLGMYVMGKEASCILETGGLTKIYMPPSGVRRLLMRAPIRKEITAVDNANITVKKGEVFGLLGPNGAGKTTLVKMLTTLLRPTSGTATIGGYDVVDKENQVKNLIGLVTGEERSFYWRLTGRHNLNFFAGLYGIPRSETPKRVDQVLELLGLSDAADNMFYSYSSGMKQKLSIARALLPSPKLLFLDEPTKSVDVVAIADIKQFIRKSTGNQRMTVILATHRLEEAEELCDRIAIIDKGKVLFIGTVDELRKKLGAREQYAITINNFNRERCLSLQERFALSNLTVKNPGSSGAVKLNFTFSNGHNPLSDLLSDVLSTGGTILSCEKRERKLEEMFINLVKGDCS